MVEYEQEEVTQMGIPESKEEQWDKETGRGVEGLKRKLRRIMAEDVAPSILLWSVLESRRVLC